MTISTRRRWKQKGKKYGPMWRKISRQVRVEAGQRCEECNVVNGATGYRDPQTAEFILVPFADRAVVAAVLERFGSKLFRIVLSVHHRDFNPTNNERTNLVALCQRCHLAIHRMARESEAADSKHMGAVAE